MEIQVHIGEVIDDPGRWVVIDVRSPGEFLAGHIPGAINIPLFTDEERARVGTLYKQHSPDKAMQEGLGIAGNKMTEYITAIRQLDLSNKNIAVHCWRGGKRSEAMQWLFGFTGMQVARITGGYKSYRQALHDFFESMQPELRVLGGCTGAGKTEILTHLKSVGEQVIDLEELAHHKGSAFGSIGEEKQPSNEQFENELFQAFLKFDLTRPIWLENESKNIGRVYLPEPVWHKMRNARLYNIEVDREVRLDRALSYYAFMDDTTLLRSSFDKIRKRLGGLEYQNAVKALENKDLRSAASIALTYYDKMYNYQLQHWPEERVVNVDKCNDPQEAANRLITMKIDDKQKDDRTSKTGNPVIISQ